MKKTMFLSQPFMFLIRQSQSQFDSICLGQIQHIYDFLNTEPNKKHISVSQVLRPSILGGLSQLYRYTLSFPLVTWLTTYLVM